MFRVTPKTAKLKRSMDMIPYDTYLDYVKRSILVSHIWQKRFSTLVQEAPWSCDFTTQTLTLGTKTYPITLLGTESYEDHTWLWAWDNPSGFPASLYKKASCFQLLGEQKHIQEFQEAMLPLTTPTYGGTGLFDGRICASIASVFHEPKCCYYKAPYDLGAAYILLHHVEDTVFQPLHAEEVMSGLLELIQMYPISHRMLIEGSEAFSNIKVEKTNQGYHLHIEESILHITIDKQDRIKEIMIKA